MGGTHDGKTEWRKSTGEQCVRNTIEHPVGWQEEWINWSRETRDRDVEKVEYIVVDYNAPVVRKDLCGDERRRLGWSKRCLCGACGHAVNRGGMNVSIEIETGEDSIAARDAWKEDGGSREASGEERV